MLVDSCFVPQRYEPNYPYPLLVMFHNRGADEQQMERRLPSMSWRNYVGLSLRGTEAVMKKGRLVGYGWGPEFSRRERERPPIATTRYSPGEIVRRSLLEGELDPIDRLEDAVFASIKQTRRALHIHSERIFLVGYGEGAAVAYRLGLTYPERFAGVVAINGWLPGGFRPLARLAECRKTSILVVHGEWNDRYRIEDVRRDVATMRSGGLKVAFQSYPTAHRPTGPMLSDVDTWIIHQCTDSR
jgi:phospholipase/carboxylesterase